MRNTLLPSSIDARLGMRCIVSTGATIDHDCNLGDGVHVSPGANLGGRSLWAQQRGLASVLV